MRQQQECCLTPEEGLKAGEYVAYPNPTWMESDPIPEGGDAHGRSTFTVQNNELCSLYTLHSHRARVEPLCEGPRDSLEWVALRDFISGNNYACP